MEDAIKQVELRCFSQLRHKGDDLQLGKTEDMTKEEEEGRMDDAKDEASELTDAKDDEGATVDPEAKEEAADKSDALAVVLAVAEPVAEGVSVAEEAEGVRVPEWMSVVATVV